MTCSAVKSRSPYLTCDRLLSDRVLVGFMWLIGVNALCGNLFVLLRNKSKAERNKVQTFLLSNLAISDLLMGIYMLMIASADIYFGEHFPMQAESWRTGTTCRIAGAVSIVSTEASVFFVTLISFDRFINIRFPFSKRKLRKKSSAVIAGSLWCISLTMGIVPSILAGDNYRFYDNSNVCIGLPLAQLQLSTKDFVTEKTNADAHIRDQFNKHIVTSETLDRVPGLFYATAIFLGVNGISYLLILICYIEILRFVLRSSKRAGLNKDMREQVRMTMKVAAIVLTDFFCWAPVILLGILVQASVVILPPSVYAWSVTVILPINSAINPYLYTIAGIISDRRKQAKVSPSESEINFTSSRSNQQQTSCTKDTDLPKTSSILHGKSYGKDSESKLETNTSTYLAEANV